MLTVYHNPRCSKSRQALALVEESGQPFEVVEYLKDFPADTVMQDMLNAIGRDALLRTGEADFKEHFKGQDLTDAELISLLRQYPKVLERAVVTDGKQWVVARPPEKVEILF